MLSLVNKKLKSMDFCKGLTPGLVLLLLYILSLLTSMAGMEFFSTLIFLGALFRLKSEEARKLILSRKILLLPFLFWLSIVLGAYFNPLIESSTFKYIAGEGRWALILVSLFLYASLLVEHLTKWVVLVKGVLAVLVALALYQTFTGSDALNDGALSISTNSAIKYWRAKGFFSGTMTFSHFLAMWTSFISSLFFIQWVKGRQLNKALGFLSLMLILVTFLTLTRGAWIAVVGGVLLSAFLAKRKLGALLAGAMFLFLLIAVSGSTVMRERVMEVVNSSTESTSARKNLWLANLHMFKTSPLLGVGYRENSARTEEVFNELGIVQEFIGHAHNSYLQILAGTGIIGFVPLYGFYLVIFFRNLKLVFKLKSREDRVDVRLLSLALGALAAQFSFHLSGLTESVITDGELVHNILFFIAIYLGVELKCCQKNKKEA